MNKFTDYNKGRKAHQAIDMAFTEYPCCMSFAQNGTQAEFIRQTGHHPNCPQAPQLPKANLLLHLRFVELKDAVVSEVFLADGSIYGRANQELPFNLHCEIPEICIASITSIKSMLNDWANSLETEKPLPRVEKVRSPMSPLEEGAYRVTDSTGSHGTTSPFILSTIEEIVGHEIPVYTPQKYRAEWIEPFNFGSVVAFHGYEATIANQSEGFIQGADAIIRRFQNQLAELPQVYEFKLWRE